MFHLHRVFNPFAVCRPAPRTEPAYTCFQDGRGVTISSPSMISPVMFSGTLQRSSYVACFLAISAISSLLQLPCRFSPTFYQDPDRVNNLQLRVRIKTKGGRVFQPARWLLSIPGSLLSQQSTGLPGGLQSHLCWVGKPALR